MRNPGYGCEKCRLELFFGFSGTRTFLFHFAEHVGHIIDLFPDLPTHVNGRFLLSRHGDTIAWPSIDLNYLALMQLVLGTQDHPGKVGAPFKIVNDDPLNPRPQGHQDIGHKIVGQRAFLLGAAHEHRNGLANGLINVNYEDLLIVSDEDSTPAGRRDDRPDLHFDDGFTHEAKLLVVVGSRQRQQDENLGAGGNILPAVPEPKRRGVALGLLRREFSGARPERNGFRATITATPWKQPRLLTLRVSWPAARSGEPQLTRGQTDQAFHQKFAHCTGQRNAAPLRSRLPTRV
jgi:hypothetical protein